MKTILLAAGQSKRVKPIVDKSFVTMCGKPLIEWQITALQSARFNDLVIVGNASNVEKLRQVEVEGVKIQVVEQEKLELGMLGAMLSAKPQVIDEDAVLVVSANDVVEEGLWENVKRKTENEKTFDGFLVGYKVNRYFPGGYLKLSTHDHVTTIVEKPGEGKEPSDLVNLVIHYHRDVKNLYEAMENVKRKTQNEKIKDDLYEKALQTLFDQGKRYTVLPYDGFWQAVKYPWHFLRLMEFYLGKLSPRVAPDVEIAKTAVLHGNVVIESGVKVLDYAVINGPAYIGKGTLVGNFVSIRGSSIGQRCVIGSHTELVRSLLQDDVWTHRNYIGDSVIGSNVAFGSGTVTGNLRLDEGEISVQVSANSDNKQGKKMNSRRTKLGIITGDNIRVGINTSFMPGVKIGSNTIIGPGLTVGEDIGEGKYVKNLNDIRENTKVIGRRE